MNITTKIFLIVVVGLLANAGLYMNAGYFSHDEIGWGIKAVSSASISDIKFYSMFNYNEFHYRPLNFNLWLLTSFYFYNIPQVFHLVLLSFGLINSILIYFIVKDVLGSKVAFLSAALSSLMPSVVFVNGWIGTIADIFWFMCCCISFFLYLKVKTHPKYKIVLLVLSFLFLLMSLMFKETAVVYPGIVFIYLSFLYIYPRAVKVSIDKIDVFYFFACSLLVLLYLYLRIDFLFPSNGGGYGTSLSNIPVRMLEYFIFPFLIDNIEIHGLLIQYTMQQIVVAILIHVFFIVVLCGKNYLNYFFYVCLYYVGSIPILILDMSLPHYIYTSGFVLAFALSVIFNKGGWYKLIGAAFFALLFAHSFNVQKNYLETGTFQNNFTTSLYTLISNNPNKNCQYLINAEPGAKSWIAVRAISFRKNINDLVLTQRIVFDKDSLDKVNITNVCNLSLNVSGHVKLSGDKNEFN